MEGLPPAMMIVTEDEVMSHGHVLYGLVKPSKDVYGVESTAAMVNVVPRKRIYRMERIEELEIFKNELLLRPLVLQPEVVSGTGSRYLRSWNVDCGICVNRESWIVMVNQNHPKIMGRIQMGVDIAIKTMKEGEPFVLEFNFSDVLKRLYHDIVADLSPKNKDREYADCEFGDLIVRYPGDEAHQSMIWGIKARQFCFAFEDLEAGDVTLRTRMIASAEQTSPAIICRTHEELNLMLPGWMFLSDEEKDSTDHRCYGYDQSHSEDHTAVGRVEDQHGRPARIKGRSQRGVAYKYDVPVELHVPVTESNIGQQMSQDDGYEPSKVSDKYSSHRSVGQTVGPNSHHTKQASGSDRSAVSSAADSGYDGGHTNLRKGIVNNISRNGIEKYKTEFSQERHFDNPAYDFESNSDDILQHHKALAAKMLQEKDVSENERTQANNYRHHGREKGYRDTSDRCRDDSEFGLSIDYDNSSEYGARSRTNEMGESFI